MAEVPNNLTQLIAQLKGADLTKLAESLETIAKGSNTANKAAAALLKNLQSGMKEQEALNEALKKSYGALIDDENRAAEATKTRLKALELINKASGKEATATANLAKAVKNYSDELAALEKIKNKNLTTDQKNTAAISQQLSLTKQLKASTDALAKNTTAMGAGMSTTLSGLAPTSGAAKTLGAIGKSESFREVSSFLLAFGAQKAPLVGEWLNKMMTKAKELYTELSTVTTGFASFTGQVMRSDSATKNLAGRVITLQRRNRMLGATIKVVTETMTSLTKASRTYGILIGTNRKQNTALADGLTEMGIRFAKVGLGAEGFGKALDTIGKTYRKSNIIGQGKILGAELVNIARVTGQAADTVANNFDAAMANLAAYSLPKARAEFRKLSAISAVTGVEMSKMLTVATQFDNIETAANAVGELNAMMGGPYLNTLDLVNATESERIEMLKNMMTQSGETFNQMDRFKQKAIAQTIGTDVREASRLFSGSQKEIDSIGKSVQTQGASYRQLGRAAKTAATSTKDQFAAVGENALLMQGAFKATDRLARNANLQLFKLGDAFKKGFGDVAVGALNRANNKINDLKGQFVGFDGSLKGTVKLVKSLGEELLKIGILKGQGMALQFVASETQAQMGGAGRTESAGNDQAERERRTNVVGTPQPIEAQAMAEMSVTNTALAAQSLTATQKLAAATQQFSAALNRVNDKKIQIDLNLDGEVLASKITGINAQA